MRLFSNRSQMTSECGKNKKVAHEAQPNVSLVFLPHFAVPCDLLLNRRTATWNQFVLSGAEEQELATPILILCHGIFTDWSIFSTRFLVWKKGSSGPVTQWRQLVSCDWLWHSHGSLIQSRFNLKINRSIKMPWQKYSGVACSCS